MASSFTINKHIEEPASGDFVNAWASPVNANWTLIDTALGGTTTISVTGVAAGGYALTLAQYQPLNIEFTGSFSANISYFIPTGVGGIWSVSNNTTPVGAPVLEFFIAAGNGIALPPGRSLIVSDGADVFLAQTLTFSRLTDMISNGQVPQSAVTQWQSALSISGAQITSGTVPNAHLPNPGVGPGVTIAADPGTTPTGAAGQIFYYF